MGLIGHRQRPAARLTIHSLRWHEGGVVVTRATQLQLRVLEDDAVELEHSCCQFNRLELEERKRLSRQRKPRRRRQVRDCDMEPQNPRSSSTRTVPPQHQEGYHCAAGTWHEHKNQMAKIHTHSFHLPQPPAYAIKLLHAAPRQQPTRSCITPSPHSHATHSMTPPKYTTGSPPSTAHPRTLSCET